MLWTQDVLGGPAAQLSLSGKLEVNSTSNVIEKRHAAFDGCRHTPSGPSFIKSSCRVRLDIRVEQSIEQGWHQYLPAPPALRVGITLRSAPGSPAKANPAAAKRGKTAKLSKYILSMSGCSARNVRINFCRTRQAGPNPPIWFATCSLDGAGTSRCNVCPCQVVNVFR